MRFVLICKSPTLQTDLFNILATVGVNNSNNIDNDLGGLLVSDNGLRTCNVTITPWKFLSFLKWLNLERGLARFDIPLQLHGVISTGADPSLG